MMNRPVQAAAWCGCLLLLSACAQQAARPQAPAATAADSLAPEDRVAFFVNDARDGRIDAVRQALDGGVAVNAKDSLEQTALLAAVSHNQLEEVKLLLARGADPNLADNAGWTPLHYAAWFGSGTVILTELLDHGARIDARNDRGITPLYFAAATGHDPQVRLLLARGADRSIASNSGYTPLRVAQVKGLDAIAALLDPQAARTASANGAADAPNAAASGAH